MPKCKYYEVCGRNADKNTGDGLCVIHSANPEKSKDAFGKALAQHRKKNGDKFRSIVFPGDIDFSGSTFNDETDFSRATFSGVADFSSAKFTAARADFTRATFTGLADFSNAEFIGGRADFFKTTFTGGAYFRETAFSEGASFFGARLTSEADFFKTKFSKGANFRQAAFAKVAYFFWAEFTGGSAFFNEAHFAKLAVFTKAEFSEVAVFIKAAFMKGANFTQASFTKGADFREAKFLERTLFASGQEVDPERSVGRILPIFFEAEVDFRGAIIEPLEALTFRDADLRKSRFAGTDLRKAEITNAMWPEMDRPFPLIPRRSGVYDEKAPLGKGQTREWPHIERVYRELKQNCEDRKDYERASDFHYGEKEMRRKNPGTSWGSWCWLTLYWLVSGYGERYWRPLYWAAGLLFASAGLYLCLGLHAKAGGAELYYANTWDTLRALFYSFRVMTLLKPEDLEPIRYAKLVHAFESLLGPVLFGLFALALRQRLKR